DTKIHVIRCMGDVHNIVSQSCTLYFQRFRRQTHVTPKSFLGFVARYKDLYTKRLTTIQEMANQMSIGLSKLDEATLSVDILTKELVVKEKDLNLANIKADKVLAEVTESTRAAEEVKAGVLVVKNRAELIVKEIGNEKEIAEVKLEEARPALEEAEAALGFPKDTINEEIIDLLSPYLAMEDFTHENAKKVCGDVAGLASWIRAMCSFFAVNKEVLPLKANLAIQEARLDMATNELNEAQAQLDEKEAVLAKVQAQYDAAQNEKQRLLDDALSCKKKMEIASVLISRLGGEHIRWTNQSKEFAAEIERLMNIKIHFYFN
ncbi:hypothetical protein HELRODRAFT_86550, partial [Helobdella robusta]|uniref:Dynein heavy chain coiled coil stalk domain-containing protein n=1 Tax=Helobdella robusta TaxID=6412 RepID=T1G6D8_HELRO